MKLTKAVPKVPAVRPEMERFFDRFFGAPLFPLREAPVFETEWSPSLDCSETDKEFIVHLEIPGVHKENLDVNLEGNMLTLSGKREVKKEQESEEYIWQEREEGKFIRSLRLPKAVDPKAVMAVYENGVLTVHLPKAEPEIKSKIVIK